MWMGRSGSHRGGLSFPVGRLGSVLFSARVWLHITEVCMCVSPACSCLRIPNSPQLELSEILSHLTDHVPFLLLRSRSLDAAGRMSAPIPDHTDPDPNHLDLAAYLQSRRPASGEHTTSRPGKDKGGEKEGGREGREGGQRGFWGCAKRDYDQFDLTRTDTII